MCGAVMAAGVTHREAHPPSDATNITGNVTTGEPIAAPFLLPWRYGVGAEEETMKQGYDELREIAEDTAEQIKSWADLLEKEDTNRRRYAESMTAERDKLRHEHGNLSDSVTYLDTVITDLREERDQLRGENNRLEAERDGLSARLKAALDARDYYCQDRDELLAERDEATNELSREIPRVITAEELREGQEAAINLRDGSWFAGAVSGLNRVISDGSTATGPASGLDGYTIVLLADAPAKDVSGSASTRKESGEDFPCPSVGDAITDEGQLRVLPYQTVVLDEDGEAWQKGYDGGWYMAGSNGPVPSYSLLNGSETLTVVHIPEEGA